MFKYLYVNLLLFYSLSLFSISNNEVKFSHKAGIYSSGFTLKIQSLIPNSKLFYTIDGSIPTSKSISYLKPISIKESIVIRVVSISDKNISQVYTNSYIVENRKLFFPVISISVDPYDMFDPIKGLYSLGPTAAKEAPHNGANFHKETELEINIEYFDTLNISRFNQEAGLRIYGGYSRAMPQKSFGIISRNSYGKKYFDYPIFPDLKFNKYKSFVLRNSGSDNNKAHFRDVLMTQLVKDLSFDIQSYRTCIVYINGKYWGIYHIREKLNEHFLKQHYNLDKDSVTIMKHRYDLRIGKQLNYNDVLEFIRSKDLSDKNNLDSLSKLIDIDNFLDYNIAQTYFANTDAGGNIRYWRTWEDTSKWRWLMFDTDFGFGLDGSEAYKKNSIIDFTKQSNEAWPYPAWATLFIRKLLDNDSIKNVYINKSMHNINTIFDSTEVLRKIDVLVDELKTEIPYQYARWGHSMSNWVTHVNRLRDFAVNRPVYMVKHLQSYFGLTDRITVSLKSSSNGKLYINGTIVYTSFTGNYFKDIPISIDALPNKYYEFSHWIGSKSLPNSFYLPFSSSIHLKPVFNKKPKSKNLKKIVFSEFSLKGGKDVGDWLELYNNSNQDLEISNWTVVREDDNKVFTIPNGTIIKKNSFLIVAREKKKVDKFYKIKSLDNLFSLKDTNTIVLYDNKEQLVDSIHLTFNGEEHIELKYLKLVDFNTKKWISNDSYTPGSLNRSQIIYNQFIFFFTYIVLPFLAIVFLFSIIFIVLKYFRSHSSTE